MAQPYLGEIRVFAFGFNPKNWLVCAGQLLPIQPNQALFALLGTIYGGNGFQTFALPDLRGRVPLHQGTNNGTYFIGETAGTETVSMLLSNLPTHTHTVAVSTQAATLQNPAGAILSAPDARVGPAIYEPGTGVAMAAGSLGLTGSGTSFSMLQPTLVLNLCIATAGIFPSRN